MSDPRYVENLIRQIHVLLDHVRESYERLQVEAVTDFGTGVYNRRYFLRRLAEELHRGERYDGVFSLIILDMDDLKRYNDAHGHVAGDRLLERYARSMQQSLRKPDFVARWGGDEFVILLPGTGEQEALRVAGRLREQFESFGPDAPGVSMGVAAFPTHGSSPQELIRLADAALYVAKQQGKNRAVGGSHHRVDATLKEHYGATTLMASQLEQVEELPLLGGGTPIDAPDALEGAGFERDTPAAGESITQEPGDLPAQASLPADRKERQVAVPGDPERRGTVIRPKWRSQPINTGFNRSVPITVGYAANSELPVCFWMGTTSYSLHQFTPADIVSATGLDSYFNAVTPQGRCTLRRRGTEWFLELGFSETSVLAVYAENGEEQTVHLAW